MGKDRLLQRPNSEKLPDYCASGFLTALEFHA